MLFIKRLANFLLRDKNNKLLNCKMFLCPLCHDHIVSVCRVDSESGHTFGLFCTDTVVTMDTPQFGNISINLESVSRSLTEFIRKCV
jgi:hypothetical protein